MYYESGSFYVKYKIACFYFLHGVIFDVVVNKIHVSLCGQNKSKSNFILGSEL